MLRTSGRCPEFLSSALLFHSSLLFITFFFASLPCSQPRKELMYTSNSIWVDPWPFNDRPACHDIDRANVILISTKETDVSERALCLPHCFGQRPLVCLPGVLTCTLRRRQSVKKWPPWCRSGETTSRWIP